MALDDAPDDAERRRRALADGAQAEGLVAERLQDDGWTVVARNWTGGGGELDLVVSREGQLRFVEVKARRPDDPVGIEAIDRGKRRRLVGAARAFLAQWEDLFDEACFLVVLVHLPPGDGDLDTVAPGELQLEWIDNAFDA